ncbi:MAG TPA: methyltransferase domain-containing protein [Gemmatimonadaceae bacterium]|nr:methyltransferase domain-containing protein [Gemmatimonadaceae bacterium]
MSAAVAWRESLGVVCPRCRGGLATRADAFDCARCGVHYPVVLGIADFRLEADPWIGLEDDREKARRLEQSSRGASLEAMVRTYWSMTPGTSVEQASRFVHHVMNAGARSREWVERLDPAGGRPSGSWLDVGTGTGDLACAAAEQGIRVVGIDVAMRWLVVARRRAELAGAPVDFICCNAEHLPFADRTFARVVSVGTLEHCRDAEQALAESNRVLVSQGDIKIRTVNRFTMLSEPHVGVWGVGFVPRRLADRYVRWRGGQGYAHHRPLSSRELRRGMRRAGFTAVRVEPASLLAIERARLGSAQWAGLAYERARRLPLVSAVLRASAPLLEAQGVAA